MSDSRNSPSLSDLPTRKTIVLVGMMGVGKTTIGRRLAQLMGLPFHDADEEIERASGMSVSDYFAQYGEQEFRKGERRVIRRLLGGEQHVLATGGGAFTDSKTRNLIAEVAVSVWLDADLDVVLERVSKRDTRPLLKTDNPKAVLEQLMADRRAFYEQADVHVLSERNPHKQTANKILDALRDFSQHGTL